MNAALPTFSDEAVVRNRIALLGIAGSFLAALSGISQSRLSLAFAGQRSFTLEEGKTLRELTARLVELKDAAGIFPLALHDAKAVRRLLNRMDERQIDAEQVRVAVQTLFGE